MHLQSLHIRRKDYGTNAGKFIAEVTVDDEQSKLTLQLSEEASRRLLAVAKDELVAATHDAALELELRIHNAMPTLEDAKA